MTDSPTVAAFAIAAGQRSMLGGDNDADADADLDDDLYGESEQEAPGNGIPGTELSHTSTPLFASNVPEPSKASHARDHNTMVAAAAATHLSPSSMALSFADIPMTGPDLPVQLSPGSLAATMNLNASSDADASNEQARSLTSSGDDGMKALSSLVSTARDPTEADDLSQTPTGGVSANGALMLPPASADLPSRPSVDMNLDGGIRSTSRAHQSLITTSATHRPGFSRRSWNLLRSPKCWGEPASPNYHRMWDRYVTDEKRYMAEQKWDRFPEGSRVFIGNLSSDKVTKRDVFALFHRFGRLAQISLKSAFGFVQYHTLEEAQAAVENLQGVEVKGRKIHLEFSRTQKKKDAKEERARSPDRGPRGREAVNKGAAKAVITAPIVVKNPMAGTGNLKIIDLGTGPCLLGLEGGTAETESRILLLLQEVDPNFVNWVRGAFIERGLRTDVMIVNPAYHIKKDIISRLVVDGVCGIVELDFKGQDRGEVYLHLYDLSRGLSNVSFNEYQGLKPATAADLVSQTKSKPSYQTAQPSYGSGPQTGFYGQPPATQPMIPAAASAYHHGQPGPGAYPQAPTHASAPAGVDLQQILSQLQKPGLPNKVLQRRPQPLALSTFKLFSDNSKEAHLPSSLPSRIS
ncbi:unnamed protein product [Parascedosporium putredinis]|uniref:RRM domain-containing protein n=1 Tax=Parascedosporium putredinis TaxID=1442378 RepID=A0A9P1H7N7_9PEZI|nr:unnamed protein product [Parascedosporium putredinis]CAI8000014.1 unnamed protein product [Parascedosporium putredinis]